MCQYSHSPSFVMHENRKKWTQCVLKHACKRYSSGHLQLNDGDEYLLKNLGRLRPTWAFSCLWNALYDFQELSWRLFSRSFVLFYKTKNREERCSADNSFNTYQAQHHKHAHLVKTKCFSKVAWMDLFFKVKMKLLKVLKYVKYGFLFCSLQIRRYNVENMTHYIYMIWRDINVINLL